MKFIRTERVECPACLQRWSPNGQGFDIDDRIFDTLVSVWRFYSERKNRDKLFRNGAEGGIPQSWPSLQRRVQ